MSKPVPPSQQDSAGPYYPAPTGSPYYGAYQGGPGESDPGGIDIKDLLVILKRRRRLIFTVIAIGTGLAAMVGFNQPPKYTAETLLMIDPQNQVVDMEAVMAGIGADAAAVETQVKLLHSHDYLGQIAERLYGRSLANGDNLEEESWTKAAVQWLPEDFLIATGLAEEPRMRAPELTYELAREKKIGELRGNLSISQQGRSHVISVKYTSLQPRESARVANALADLYLEDQVDRKLAGTRKANQWLETRLEELEAEVRAAEQAVEEYRAKHDLAETSEVLDTNSQQMLDLTNMLVQTRAERKEKETRLNYVRSLQERGESLNTLSEVLSSGMIQRLMDQDAELQQRAAELSTDYGERHPVMQNIAAEREELAQRIQTEIGNVIDNMANELEVLRTREASIQADIDRIGGSIDQANQAQIELRKLRREAEANRQIYENFLQRYKETREQQDIVEPDARIIARAKTPQTPSSLKPEFFALVGFVGSSMLGVLLALLRERLDNAVRSGKEIEAEFGVPCIGLVPFLKGRALKNKGKPHEYLVDKPLSTYAETIRSIYTSLRLTNVDHPPKVIQVTSSVPQEGKTTLAVSFAAALVQNGLKAVLVDLDMRHPSVKREVDVAQEGMLIEYMTGECGLEELITTDPKSGVDVIGVRRTPPNPPRLLGSQRMRELMEVLRERYDVVILDSTPVLGVSDSKLTMELADSVLFVVRWEKTTRDTAGDAFKELKGVGAEIGGVVITQVDIDRHAQYGYGGIDNYYGNYKKYYVN